MSIFIFETISTFKKLGKQEMIKKNKRKTINDYIELNIKHGMSWFILENLSTLTHVYSFNSTF
jgi:uncharacterized protein YutD